MFQSFTELTNLSHRRENHRATFRMTTHTTPGTWQLMVGSWGAALVITRFSGGSDPKCETLHTFLWGIRPKCETLQPQPLVWGRGREGYTFTSADPAPLAHGPHNDGFRRPARTGPKFPDTVGSWGQRDPQSTGEGVRKTTPGSAASVVGPLGPSGGL